jgi:hypothetical protein
MKAFGEIDKWKSGGRPPEGGPGENIERGRPEGGPYEDAGARGDLFRYWRACFRVKLVC